MSDYEKYPLVLGVSPLSNYWAIGGSTTEVYSSATNTMVPVTDPAYVEWSASHTAVPIASVEELGGVLKATEALPSWMMDTEYFIQPSPGNYNVYQLYNYARTVLNARLAEKVNLGDRLRALELFSQGHHGAVNELFAKTNEIYNAFDGAVTGINGGTIKTLAQVNAAFG